MAVYEPPPKDDPGTPTPEDAAESVALVIADLEAAAARGGRLSERERNELYRRASGSLAAVSLWVDGGDPSQRALLEDTYQQLRSLMRELELEPVAPDREGHIPAQQR
ncbi:MAG: hypothetical protein KC431_03715 [Myxococcales bacterium]|nr:hypothetical protein [Myxococcales bacterium]